MSAAHVLADLEARGFRLALAGDRLTVKARAGSVPPDVLAEVREHKPEILALLALRDGDVPRADAQSPVRDPDRPPAGSVDGLDPRQLAAAEALGRLAGTEAVSREGRTVGIELPAGGTVWILPERTGKPRAEVTWAELTADPLAALAGVTTLLAAVREFGGRIVLPASQPKTSGRGPTSPPPGDLEGGA